MRSNRLFFLSFSLPCISTIQAATNATPYSEEPAQPTKSADEMFKSLPDAVWWSVCQCANLVAVRTHSEHVATPSVGQPVGGAAFEDMCRRLTGCILLVGGGQCGPAGELMAKWLADTARCVVERQTASLSSVSGNNNFAVDVFFQSDQPDLVWKGSRLVLVSNQVNDLWINASEWKRIGSRALREKAPFPW